MIRSCKYSRDISIYLTCSLLLLSSVSLADAKLLNPTFTDPVISEDYSVLVKQVKANQATQKHFDALRFAYAKSAQYTPYSRSELNQTSALNRAYTKQQWASCIIRGNQVLATNYTSLGAHFLLYRCYDEAGNANRAEFHLHVTKGLIGAIRNTGDGVSFDSAFVTFTTLEVRSFVQLQGYKIESTKTVQQDGNAFDVLQLSGLDESEPVTMYFNISEQWASLSSVSNNLSD